MPAYTLTRSRRPLIVAAIRLSLATIGWNLLAGAVSIAAWLVTGSLSLGGFGLNTLIDLAASIVLVWRFWRDRDDPKAAAVLERRAEVAIGCAMLGVAIFLSGEAVHALKTGSHPDTSPLGLGVTTASLVLLPWLAHAKGQVARGIPSRALRADAILTGASAALAALTLLSLVANSAFGWWWADAAAALLIAVVLVADVLRAARAIVRKRRDGTAPSLN